MRECAVGVVDADAVSLAEGSAAEFPLGFAVVDGESESIEAARFFCGNGGDVFPLPVVPMEGLIRGFDEEESGAEAHNEFLLLRGGESAEFGQPDFALALYRGDVGEHG